MHPASIKAVLKQAAASLRASSDSPALDAELLLAWVLERPRSYLFGHPEALLPAPTQMRFWTIIERRRLGVPVAYLTGRKEFWSLDLKVTDAALVPRPETETLVAAALARLPADTPAWVADLGTGCGAIALAIATERCDCRVIATDVEPAALALAGDNAQRLGLTNVDLRLGDWFAPLAGERFDMLVSNPPYLARDDPHLAALVHEPRAALVAPDDGLHCLRHLISNAPVYLKAGGWLLMEHGVAQAAALRQELQNAGFLAVATVPDLAGRPRITVGCLEKIAVYDQ